jgi:hypothetical protein
MSVLLTDEAYEAVLRLPEQPTQSRFNGATYDVIVEAFLRYHATEGREALVEAVADVCIRLAGSDWPAEKRKILGRWFASGIVTALVGEKP